MRDPFNSMDGNSQHQHRQPSLISSGGHYSLANGTVGPSGPDSDIPVSHEAEREPLFNKLIADESSSSLLDPEIKALYFRSRTQEEEIVQLRKQIVDASNKELQLLSEKHILERKLSDLRMALDEKQNDTIAITLKELSQKKGHIEENIRLESELKVAEEEVFVFTSLMLRLLAEYDVRPSLLNAATITVDTKRFHHQMQWKLRSLLGRASGIGANISGADNHLIASYTERKLTSLSQYPHHPVDGHTNHGGFVQHVDMVEANQIESQREALTNNGVSHFFHDTASGADVRLDDNSLYYMGSLHNNHEFIIDGDHPLPGIEGFQIVGEPSLGNTLTACGYRLNGTTLCIFQWFRFLDDGNREIIEGATMPDYVVTADDVGTVLGVVCTPMDDSGHQGELVSEYANGKNRITCDSEMQSYLDMYISSGKAIFDALVLVDSSDEWELASLVIRRSGYQIKVKHSETIIIEEKYSPELYIKVPNGLSSQFALISSGGTQLTLNTSGMSNPSSVANDIRLRDTIVLVVRHFQSMALDNKRKGKA